ncbi:hypothetical protein FKM82_000056 [Ascaphus truei]
MQLKKSVALAAILLTSVTFNLYCIAESFYATICSLSKCLQDQRPNCPLKLGCDCIMKDREITLRKQTSSCSCAALHCSEEAM